MTHSTPAAESAAAAPIADLQQLLDALQRTAFYPPLLNALPLHIERKARPDGGERIRLHWSGGGEHPGQTDRFANYGESLPQQTAAVMHLLQSIGQYAAYDRESQRIGQGTDEPLQEKDALQQLLLDSHSRRSLPSLLADSPMLSEQPQFRQEGADILIDLPAAHAPGKEPLNWLAALPALQHLDRQLARVAPTAARPSGRKMPSSACRCAI